MLMNVQIVDVKQVGAGGKRPHLSLSVKGKGNPFLIRLYGFKAIDFATRIEDLYGINIESDFAGQLGEAGAIYVEFYGDWKDSSSGGGDQYARYFETNNFRFINGAELQLARLQDDMESIMGAAVALSDRGDVHGAYRHLMTYLSEISNVPLPASLTQSDREAPVHENPEAVAAALYAAGNGGHVRQGGHRAPAEQNPAPAPFMGIAPAQSAEMSDMPADYDADFAAFQDQAFAHYEAQADFEPDYDPLQDFLDHHEDYADLDPAVQMPPDEDLSIPEMSRRRFGRGA